MSDPSLAFTLVLTQLGGPCQQMGWCSSSAGDLVASDNVRLHPERLKL
jgi:hypothetical protein